MKEELLNAIARLKVGNVRGTGFLINDRNILTALHVVADRKNNPPIFEPDSINVAFPGGKTTAKIVKNCWNADTDWALLECDTPLHIPPVPLADFAEDQAKWDTFGFPETNTEGMVYNGYVANRNGEWQGVSAIQLFSDQAAAGNGSPVRGLSGAPCIVGGAATGILRSSPLAENRNVAGTLYACPICSVISFLSAIEIGFTSGKPKPTGTQGGIPSNLNNQLRNTFLECSEFNTNQSLRAVFMTPELKPFRNDIPRNDSPPPIKNICGKYFFSGQTGFGMIFQRCEENIYIRRFESNHSGVS